MKNSILLIAIVTILICGFSSKFARGQWQLQTTLSNNPCLFTVSTVSKDVTWIFGGLGSQIYRTTNGGQTWIHTKELKLAGTIPTTGLAIDSLTAFVGTSSYSVNAGLYRTSDGGESWEMVLQVGSGNYWDWIHFFNDSSGITECGGEVGEHSMIFKTNNRGDTWTEIVKYTLGSDYCIQNCLHFYDDLNGWFGTYKGSVYRTTDGGDTWTGYNSGNHAMVSAVRFITPLIGIRTTSSSPFLTRTTDGGETWTPVSNIPVSGVTKMVASTSVSSQDKHQFWVSGETLDSKFIITSNDSGKTWQEQTIPELNVEHEIFHMSAVPFGAMKDSVQAFGIATGITGFACTGGGEIIDYQQPIGLGGTVTMIRSDYAPDNLHLQNYPNPLCMQTKISFVLPTYDRVILTIFNELGQEIEKLLDIEMTSGSHQVVWDATNYSSGVYFCNLRTKNYSQLCKMVLLR